MFDSSSLLHQTHISTVFNPHADSPTVTKTARHASVLADPERTKGM